MSTRANIVIKEGDQHLVFYRHSDGYPEGVKPTLNKFMDWLETNKIRQDIMQASGWLIILGAQEYNYNRDYNDNVNYRQPLHTPLSAYTPDMGWKVGAYEPTTDIHPDIEFLYEIDINSKTLKGWTYSRGKKGEQVEL